MERRAMRGQVLRTEALACAGTAASGRRFRHASSGLRAGLVAPSEVLYGPLPSSPARAMQIRNDIVEAIGNTPLIKLKQASERTGCTILGKAEFMNPGQSVKDRAALFIIEDAVKRGTLRPGGIIVEGTAGNTGIGLALVANVLGYRTVIV